MTRPVGPTAKSLGISRLPSTRCSRNPRCRYPDLHMSTGHSLFLAVHLVLLVIRAIFFCSSWLIPFWGMLILFPVTSANPSTGRHLTQCVSMCQSVGVRYTPAVVKVPGVSRRLDADMMRKQLLETLGEPIPSGCET